jgi:hypothetical protein
MKKYYADYAQAEAEKAHRWTELTDRYGNPD